MNLSSDKKNTKQEERKNETYVRFRAEGIVQGVGFRPFLHRLAGELNIRGWVRNTSFGLDGELAGTGQALDAFVCRIRLSPPPAAVVENVELSPCPPPEDREKARQFETFTIRESRISDGFTLISPDIGICPECEAELKDKSDRRYRYPFINCTNCGPRYTIIESLPYDRKNTVMKGFAMCKKCSAEYSDIRDRRYHAQPDCCPECGPQVFYVDAGTAEACMLAGAQGFCTGAGRKAFSAAVREQNVFARAQGVLKEGGILAVKGIGGIHLACDAMNPEAVKRLRAGKHRPEKPLAVMCGTLEAARRMCRISEEEERLLQSPARPIVLLAKKDKNAYPELSFSPRLGVMLPYTPLHLLLTDQTFGGPDILVMTSGNLPGCPVLTGNQEAVQALSRTADGFLFHNRKIQNRCDDSLVSVLGARTYFLRKSRGYTPSPIRLPFDADGIFAMGAEQKASFALGRGRLAFISPYIGDLKNAETLAHYSEALDTYRRLFRIRPSMYVCDLHPDYLSTREAEHAAKESAFPILHVQHHWAHMASCMTDNGVDTACFGIIWDGAGLGTDGTVWGGEFLTGDLQRFSRDGSIRPICLAGGDQAAKEIGRIALALVRDAAGLTGFSAGSPDAVRAEVLTEKISTKETAPCEAAPCENLLQKIPLPESECLLLNRLLDSGTCPRASSIGRLFDGICALILNRREVTYEGEGAALVEALSPAETADELPGGADSLKELSYPVIFYTENGVRYFDTRPLITEILRAMDRQQNSGETALRFMATLCCMALEQCITLNPKRLPVVLSGGVFQNRFLLSGITALLEKNGFSVYTHRQVSPNDEGISLGQLGIAQKIRLQEIRMQEIRTRKE